MGFIKHIWREKTPSTETATVNASIGADKRVYAIGDIHGRDDLFDALLAKIDADNAGRSPLPTAIVLLGDLVDRGPHAAQVIQRAIELRKVRNIRLLKGNHEEVLVNAASGDEKAIRCFIRIGGRETILSYGLSPEAYRAMDYAELLHWVMTYVPRTHIDFISDFENMIEIGDYLFVHAGIRPGVPLDEQKGSDLRWIREDFLNHGGYHGRLIVHGHTITDRVDICTNRVGIDTGAYNSGKLTAVGLEGNQRWYLQAEGPTGFWPIS